MSSITYRLCKNKIEKDMYNTQEELQQMLDIFFAGDRISLQEYEELSSLLNSKHSVATA